MGKVIRLTENDLVRLVNRVIKEQKVGKFFDMTEQELLRQRGFKDMHPSPFEFEKTITTSGGTVTKVKVVATECTKYPKYTGMKILVNGKEYNNGNYDKCPDACWVTLDKIIGYDPFAEVRKK